MMFWEKNLGFFCLVSVFCPPVDMFNFSHVQCEVSQCAVFPSQDSFWLVLLEVAGLA